jgi:hypothetical protein
MELAHAFLAAQPRRRAFEDARKPVQLSIGEFERAGDERRNRLSGPS